MNIIIPMAGRGTRMRPHTLTTPKPLLPIAGKPIIQRLLDNLAKASTENIDHIGFIIGADFGDEVEQFLLDLAKKYNAKGHIFYQESPEGIAHALFTAKELFTGKIIIGLADTLFRFNEQFKLEEDGIIVVQEVEDPSAFGVVTLNDNGYITALVEKPKEFVSNLAIIGIYYFKHGEELLAEIDYLLNHNIRTKGEFQLTDAIERLRNKGANLMTQRVQEWLDCGNKDATVHTNQRILEIFEEDNLTHTSVQNKNSVIIEPCYIGENVVIEDAIIGPHVSIGHHSVIKKSIVSNSIIQSHTHLENKIMTNSMLGNYVSIIGTVDAISVGDYSFKEA